MRNKTKRSDRLKALVERLDDDQLDSLLDDRNGTATDALLDAARNEAKRRGAGRAGCGLAKPQDASAEGKGPDAGRERLLRLSGAPMRLDGAAEGMGSKILKHEGCVTACHPSRECN